MLSSGVASGDPVAINLLALLGEFRLCCCPPPRSTHEYVLMLVIPEGGLEEEVDEDLSDLDDVSFC